MCGPHNAHAQEKATGPVIQGYGPAWEVPGATFPLEPGRPLRMVLEISSTPEDKALINPWLETAARFLNMHARSGVSTSDLQVALVVHNAAAPDLLANPHYAVRYGLENPNAEMLSELMAAGVEIVLCGQSSASRDVPIENTVPGVQLALSAMTALIRYQDREYRLIKF
ncbi:DsrE family protein [Robiginitalea sp. SC105]|nr:DsrE family protein [Robiginitalea sp. SC105]